MIRRSSTHVEQGSADAICPGRNTLGKVLVIDDEANVRTLLDMLLRSQGYDVILADNGWTGLQRYYQEHPDAIFLDLNMPKLDGIAVLKQIRNVDLTLPVIIVTGDTAPEREREVRALGASEFIVKGRWGHSQASSQGFCLCGSESPRIVISTSLAGASDHTGPSHDKERSGSPTTEMGTASISHPLRASDPGTRTE
jgi:CheY-like chemotaxis protein